MEGLRDIRERAGYSQQLLARESGVSQHTISEIEQGRRKPHGTTLRKLAGPLGVEVADFFPSDEKPPPTVVNLPPLEVKASSPPITTKSKVVELLERVKRDELSVEDAAARLKLRDTKAS